MGPPTRIRLCRRLEVEWEGERLETVLPGNQGRLLFAYLVLHRDRTVRRDELLEVLWSGEVAPQSADAVLSAPLSRLRKALGPGRLNGRGELSLALPPATWVDWEAAFIGVREAHAAAAAERWPDAWIAASAALEIADGGLLPGLEARWIDEKRSELEDLRLELLEVIATSGARIGGAQLPHAEQAARAAVEAAPFRESARAALIEVLRARGNVADALRAFDDARTLLREELGATPGPLLQSLHQQLLHADVPAPTARPALPDRLAAALETPLVGRREPLTRLQAELRRARAGESPVVLVTGEGGIGKTRLIAEVASAAGDFAVLYGRCDEDQLFPFGPWIELLGGALVRVADAELPALLGTEGPELARLLPELRGRVPELATPGPSDPESELRHLYTAVVALIQRLARRRPVLAIIDDLHWADRSSLLLCRHLVRTSGLGPALLLGAYRDTELGEDHPLPSILADLERDRPLPRIPLRGLDAAEVAELTGAAPDAARELREETHGNPFFVEQLVRHRDESGMGVSSGLRDVIVRRVARLPGDGGPVLRVAALIGRDFDLGVLERVVDVSEDDLLDLLDAAVRAGILVEVASTPGRYSFVHALVRTTLEAELSATRRARLHRRIAVAIEAAPDLEPWLVELARHYAAAGPEEADRAVTYAVRAAHQATVRLAYEEAADLLAGAAALRGDDARVLLELAAADARLGRVDQARDTFRRAADLARREDSAEGFAHAALGHAGGSWVRYGVDDAAGVHLLEEALALLPGADSALRVRLLARLGTLLYFSPARSTTLIEAAVEMAHRVGDDDALAAALSAAQFAFWRPGMVLSRLALAEELVEVTQRLGQPERTAEAVIWRLGAELTLGRFDAVSADTARYLGLVERLNHPELSMHGAGLRSMRALLEGRWDVAEAAAAEVLRAGEASAPILAMHAYGTVMMLLRGEQRRLGERIEHIEAITRTVPDMVAWRAPLAWAYAQAGRLEEARREVALLRQDRFAALPRDVNFEIGMAILTRVADELGDAELAAEIEPLLRPLADLWIVFGIGIGTFGPAAYSLGVCNLLAGRVDMAVGDFEVAMVKCRDMRAPLYEAHAALGLARALVQRGAPGDAARAAEIEAAAPATLLQDRRRA
ncbi:AAA family ATPase [Solirubrobacter taibaiensis]|nr:AAA family ATPase [Solirubrobacter taibaiensis]